MRGSTLNSIYIRKLEFGKRAGRKWLAAETNNPEVETSDEPCGPPLWICRRCRSGASPALVWRLQNSMPHQRSTRDRDHFLSMGAGATAGRKKEAAGGGAGRCGHGVMEVHFISKLEVRGGARHRASNNMAILPLGARSVDRPQGSIRSGTNVPRGVCGGSRSFLTRPLREHSS